jgi:hypothetical protein
VAGLWAEDRTSTAASEDALERRDAAGFDRASGLRVAEFELAETAEAVDRQVALTDGLPILGTSTVEVAGSRPVGWSAVQRAARIRESGSWPVGAPPPAVPAARFSEPAAGRLAAVCCWEVAPPVSSDAVLRFAAAASAERRAPA